MLDGEMTHAELMEQLKREIGAARAAAEANSEASRQRAGLIIEQLQAGSARFTRLERLAEEGAREARETREQVKKLSNRLEAMESAREISSGIDQGVSSKISAWRKWIGRAILLILGNGSGMVVLIWWLERQPPAS